MIGSSRTALGIGCGVAAGGLWGLVFLAPELVREFTPLQFSAARYLAYGLFAAILIAPRWRALVGMLGKAEWGALLWLSLLGNIIYYVLLASAVQMGGVAMASLVMGFLPVVVTLIGSRDTGAVPLARLVPSLLLSAAGIACIGWQSLGEAASGTQTNGAIGLLCAIGGLASWTTYAVGNSRWLDRLGQVSAHEWSLLTGVVTGALALLLVIPALMIDARPHGGSEWLRFAAVAAGLAIFASILGNALWNQMSRLLPLTLVGQMIVFETLFALLYGFLWEERLPTALEGVAIILVVASVLSCVSVHGRHDPTPSAESLA